MSKLGRKNPNWTKMVKNQNWDKNAKSKGKAKIMTKLPKIGKDRLKQSKKVKKAKKAKKGQKPKLRTKSFIKLNSNYRSPNPKNMTILSIFQNWPQSCLNLHCVLQPFWLKLLPKSQTSSDCHQILHLTQTWQITTYQKVKNRKTISTQNLLR